MRKENNEILQQLDFIEGMAKAGLPMVGFRNFVLSKEHDSDTEQIGLRYLTILEKYRCCGDGNRPHFLMVRFPGGGEPMVFRRFLDGLSGAQFYSNRMYGVLAFDFSSFENNVNDAALDTLKEYLIGNRENLRFILSHLPENGMEKIAKWKEFDIFFEEVNEEPTRQYIQRFLEKNDLPISEKSVSGMEKIVEAFPRREWDHVLWYLSETGKEKRGIWEEVGKFRCNRSDRQIGFRA